MVPILSKRDVFKSPVTDVGKVSKKGEVTTFFNSTSKTYFVDLVNSEQDKNSKDALELVFENGEIFKEYTFDDVRNNLKGK